MLSAELAQVAQFLRNRRDAIADHWYRAVASTSFAPLGLGQVRQRLNDLTEQVIALLLAEHFDRDAHAVSAPSWQTSITSWNNFTARKEGRNDG
jgi:hypothetical protein